MKKIIVFVVMCLSLAAFDIYNKHRGGTSSTEIIIAPYSVTEAYR